MKFTADGKRDNKVYTKEYEVNETKTLIKQVGTNRWIPYEEIKILMPGERQLLIGLRQLNNEVSHYIRALETGLQIIPIKKEKEKGKITVQLVSGEIVSLNEYLLRHQLGD